MSVAQELAASGADVLAVDHLPELVAKAKDFCTCAVEADVCDVGTLISLGLSGMDGVVVAITGDHNTSVIATITAKEQGAPYILAKAANPVHARILEKVGADRAIIPEKDSGIRVARSMLAGGVTEIIELSDRIRMIEIPVRPEWSGKTPRELDLCGSDGVNIIAVRRENDELTFSPDEDTPLAKKCSLIIAADRRDIERLING